MVNKYEHIKTLHEHNEKEIKELLLYHRVTKVNEDTLELDNGVVLEIIPNEGCGGCSSGWYAITDLNGVDNVITNVELDEDNSENCETSYKIFVYTEDKRFTLLQVDGDDGNGYYGTGYRINVKVPLEV